MRWLLVVTGPIGAGKSTVSARVAERLASNGSTVAVADLDDVAFAQRGATSVEGFWAVAGIAHLGLVRAWFDAGIQVVIAHGPFYEANTYHDLFAVAPADGRAVHVLLGVSVEQALERVGTDPTRGPDARSADPTFLTRTHEAFALLAPGLPPHHLAVDTTSLGVDAVADRILALLTDRTPPPDLYEDDDTRGRYLAHRHGSTSPNTVMEEPALLRAIGDVHGARVVDLGCGDGSGVAVFLQHGAASYLGIDGSAEMIALARSSCDHPAATFELRVIEDLDLSDGSADLVVSRMALHYVADFDRVVTTVRRALVPSGRFVFTVAHPVLTSHDPGVDGPRQSWVVDDYFVTGPRERSWMGATVTWHHRTVEDYIDVLIAAGFWIDTIGECPPEHELLAHDPAELRRRRRVPLVLLVAATWPG